MFNKGELWEIVKTAKVTPIYKKVNPLEKDNYQQLAFF